MAKEKNYGFKTPVRRVTNNVTGHKVVGEYSGAYAKVIRMKMLEIDGKYSIQQELPAGQATHLFQRELCVAAIGGYFVSDQDVVLCLSVEVEGDIRFKDITIPAGPFIKAGFEYSFNPTKVAPDSPVKFTISFTTAATAKVQFTQLGYGFVDYPYLRNTDVYADFYNSKKEICFPEQFYFQEEIELPEVTDGMPLILKSCNRCQRFLPLNPANERQQLGFSNHCSTKAPCTHSGFSRYQLVTSDLQSEALANFIAQSPYELKDNLVISYYGHQLECKACKKFFVNAALNHLRSSTQHREDALRRRAFERLIGELLGTQWIYHKFREEKTAEFDKHIWEKFGKKCFNCDKSLAKPNLMHLDHTMPLAYLYPLDETATCLCDTCNSLKSDLFPMDFYKSEQLEHLSKLTGLPLETLKSRRANQVVVDAVKANIIWFIEKFLTFEEYTKVREGKRAADSILHSLQKVIGHSEEPFDLLEAYAAAKKA